MSQSKLRLGLIIDPEFYMLGKSVCALTPPLIEALCRRFDTRIIWDQSRYDRLCGEVDLLVSLEPRWAAPEIKWKRAGLRRRASPGCPTFIMMSDPHIEQWRQRYFLSNEVDYILAYYDQPTRRHFARVPGDRIIHFPWAVPEQWIGDEPITCRGQEHVMIFGAARHKAYTARNWCREHPLVESYAASGVESREMSDEDFFDWLKGFDAVVAAGSFDPKFDLTTPKYFETAAVGSLLFAQRTADLEALGFRHEVNCLIFDQENFDLLVRQYIQTRDDPRWIAIRNTGRDLIGSRHTIAHRMEQLAALVRNWPGR